MNLEKAMTIQECRKRFRFYRRFLSGDTELRNDEEVAYMLIAIRRSIGIELLNIAKMKEANEESLYE